MQNMNRIQQKTMKKNKKKMLELEKYQNGAPNKDKILIWTEILNFTAEMPF